MAFTPRYGTPNFEMLRTWIGRPPEDDGPFWALNLMKYRAVADYGDGRSDGPSGKAADDAYAPVQVLADIGAMVAFFGDVLAQSGSTPQWDRVGIVRYPTRASFIDMQQRPDFQDKHVHKEAGMETTIVMSCLPDAGRPPIAVDGTLVLRVGRGDAADFPDVPGATRVATFAVEGVIIGDERTWTRAVFDVASSDDAAKELHAAPAGFDEYFALTVARSIDALEPSIVGAAGTGA